MCMPTATTGRSVPLAACSRGHAVARVAVGQERTLDFAFVVAFNLRIQFFESARCNLQNDGQDRPPNSLAQMKTPFDVQSERGSIWHRWDPHIHTPGTALNDQYAGSDPWAAFLDAIEAFLNAVNMNPALPASWGMLQSLYRMTGQAENAETAPTLR